MPRPRVNTDNPAVPIETLAEVRAIEAMPPTVVPVAVAENEEEESIRQWENVVYEAVIDGKVRRYPTTTITPKRGKFFVMRTYETNGMSRILVSPKDWNESFPFSIGPVLTKYGLADGQTCNITLKLVDVMVDISSEDIIGVYLVIMTPSFAQIDVDARKLVKTVTNANVLKVKEEIMIHEALNLKFQLDEAMQRAETYRQALFDRETNIVKLAEDFAAPIIETTLAALAATKDMFDQYYRQQEPWYEIYKFYLLSGVAAVIFLAAYYFSGGFGG